LYQAQTERDAICESMSRHNGECIDVLHAFNGPDGTEDAYAAGLMNKQDCCYPSAEGQQRIAELLFDTGLEQLQD
jgi:hypothetical protein